MEDKKTDAQRKYMRHLVSAGDTPKDQAHAEKQAQEYTAKHKGWNGANSTVKVSGPMKGDKQYKVKLK